MVFLPQKWTPIAVYSPNENRFVDLPGTKVSHASVYAREKLEFRTITDAGKKIMQVRAK